MAALCDTASKSASRLWATALGLAIAWCLAAGAGTAMAATQLVKALPSQAVRGQADEICGLPRAVFDLHKHQVSSAHGVLIGNAFGEPIYVEAPKVELQAGVIKYFAIGRRAFAVRCLETLYGKYLQHYAPLGLFKGKTAFRKLDIFCRYTRWLGGGLTVPGMRIGTAYDAKVFLPLVIQWYRDHPADAGAEWIPPTSSSKEPHLGAPADWAAERDRRLMGHSGSLIRALRAEYPVNGRSKPASRGRFKTSHFERKGIDQYARLFHFYERVAETWSINSKWQTHRRFWHCMRRAGRRGGSRVN